jgi:SPT2 chromatin protein
MSKFADILAMSKARTAVNEAAVQDAISQREAKLRAEQEAAERRHKLELERQAKMRQAQAEAEKRETEKTKLRELAAKAKEQEAERKQQAQMEKIMGKVRHQVFESREKESGGPSGHRRKKNKGSDEDDEMDGGQALTRAEKRALRMDPDARPAWAQRLVGSERSGSKEPRSSSATPHSRSPGKSKRLKHTETQFTNYLSAPSALAAQGDQSLPIRERLKTSDYFVPIKLSAVRRDTRTQADYFQEKRQRALAASGGSSQDPYADWHNKSKAEGGSSSDLRARATSGAERSLKPSAGAGPSRAGSAPTAAKSKASTGSSRNDSPSSMPRKRQRSESFSSSDLDSDTPRKRTKQSSAQSAMREEIWKLMSGKSRNHYADDVFSDEDEVMEVSMREVAKEEARRFVLLTFHGLIASDLIYP